MWYTLIRQQFIYNINQTQFNLNKLRCRVNAKETATNRPNSPDQFQLKNVRGGTYLRKPSNKIKRQFKIDERRCLE